MKRDVIVKGRGLGGSSDLTLLAPIKPGFVESLESVTYKTRIKRVLETLHGARLASHEYATARFLSDAVERVGVIHSVRVAVLEPEDKVLLAVTFDGSWESYIRVLWDKVGTLLDLIFCGTTGYVTAYDHTFDEWLAWARRVQVETGFFYGPPDFTAQDVLYHRRIERMRMRGEGTEANELRAVSPAAEELVREPYGPEPDDAPIPPWNEFTQVRTVSESIQNGLQALAGLYRLTDLYRPGTEDGDVLRHASINLLREFAHLFDRTVTPEDIAEARVRFHRQLDWLFPGQVYDVEPKRKRPAFAQLSAKDREDVQGGIVQAYENTTHGLILMLSFASPRAASEFLRYIRPRITRDSNDHRAQPGSAFLNLAFTLEGLRACGVGEDELEVFPEDFRQGMAARAGSLGDVRGNHPRRWKLPRRFVGLGVPPADDPVELQAVHAVLQLRQGAQEAQQSAVDYWEVHHPLRGEVQKLLDENIHGMRILAIQSLKRNTRDINGKTRIVEHFGYADGDGQPNLLATTPPANRTHLGEIVLGHNNAVDVPASQDRLRWLMNGSFLVMRKYHQNVGRLRKAVTQAARVMAADAGMTVEEARLQVHGKLMGRYPDGEPLVDLDPPGGLNDFDYRTDPRGDACPLHAHIRRANPREASGVSARPPRLMRRSMSYGPAAGAGDDVADADRGLVFMAYNASLSEQFEVIQRWLAGGNSTGSSSGQSCPIVGVPENGHGRHFRSTYDKGQRVLNVKLEEQPPAFEQPETVTRLEWGMYLFVPSLSVVGQLALTAHCTQALRTAVPSVPWRTADGRKRIAALKELEAREGRDAAIAAWKSAIEDPEAIDRLDSAALWAAIREEHGGILRTPYGVLVASRELLLQVYRDRDRYSVKGQRERMKASIGDISLGKDAGKNDGTEYDEESASVNNEIEKLDPGKVFTIARNAADAKIQAIVDQARGKAKDVGNVHFEVSFDVREVVEEVLADLSEDWFGIGKPFFERGSADWAWKPGKPPLYPGHFTALSRYMFQPNPGPVPVELGQAYGKALTEAMLAFVAAHRAHKTLPKNKKGEDAPIAKAVFDTPRLGGNDDFVAKTMVGVLMGFTPTIIGAVLNVLKEWHRDASFATLRSMCAEHPVTGLKDAFDLLHAPMASAAQMRPMPQIGWRIARVAHTLGLPGQHSEEIEEGDVIVLAMVSGTQQSLADGKPDGRLMFGGVREEKGPTHACPGYHAGIAAMLGTLAALLSRGEDLRGGTSAHTFEVRGKSGFVPQVAPAFFSLEAALAEAATDVCPAAIPEKNSRNGLILVWGDSWLGYVPFIMKELRDWLKHWGYDVPEDYCGFKDWLYLEKMAQHRKIFRDDFLVPSLPRSPRAIVLSAGGNDSVGQKLEEMLQTNVPGQNPIDAGKLAVHIGNMKTQLLAIIDTLQTLESGAKMDVPIIVHGYDHPIPVDQGYAPWIRTPFWNRGYVDPAAPHVKTRIDLAVAQPAMRHLIEELNAMLRKVAEERENVRYVDLTGTVAELYPGDPVSGWLDNMHPKADAFKCMAAKIAAAIEEEDA